MARKQEKEKPATNDFVSEFQGLWDDEKAAAYLGITAGTIRNKRSKGEGPRFVKFGNRVRYRRSDLDKYIDENTYDPAA